MRILLALLVSFSVYADDYEKIVDRQTEIEQFTETLSDVQMVESSTAQEQMLKFYEQSINELESH